jgi:hypothetical protein
MIVGMPVLLEVGWWDMDFVGTFLAGAGQLVYVLGGLRSLAEINAARLRSHREWANLQI